MVKVRSLGVSEPGRPRGQRTTAYTVLSSWARLATSSLLSSFLHSCHHLPYLFHSPNLTVAEMGSVRGPVSWYRSQGPEDLGYLTLTELECLQLFLLVTWHRDSLKLQGWVGTCLQPNLCGPLSLPTHFRD